MKPVKVLIFDDSLVMRENLQLELDRDPNIKIVAKCSNALEARDKIIETQPDLLIADILMEKMDGLTFVKKLLPQYPVPVIMISTDHSKKEEIGMLPNVRFVPKPQPGGEQPFNFFNQIILHIKSLIYGEALPDALDKFLSKVIVIGSSTGGAEAIESLLRELPAIMPPIVVAQHMPARFTTTFASRLNAVCALSVKEASDRDILIPSQVLIAPGGFHTTLHKRENRIAVNCSLKTEADNYACPNIDLLFRSAVPFLKLSKESITGVILTGMGKDGAQGLLELRENGAETIGQDRQSSVVYGMPRAAFELNAVAYQLPLNKIAKKLTEIVF